MGIVTIPSCLLCQILSLLFFCVNLQPGNKLLSLKLEVSAGADSELVQLRAELYSVISAHRAAVWGWGPFQAPFVSPQIKG